MLFKSTCPCCGANVKVELSPEETKLYFSIGALPKDFEERSICDCCASDGFVLEECRQKSVSYK